MKKIKALLVSALIPLTAYWAFNFAGFAKYPSDSSWAVWLFVNLLFLGAFVGLMIGLFIVTKRAKSEDASLRTVFKKLHIFAITGFVVVGVSYLLDFFIFIPEGTIAITAIIFVLVSVLLGLGIYAAVKLFTHNKKSVHTKTKITTTK